jgi:hypothetical protein
VTSTVWVTCPTCKEKFRTCCAPTVKTTPLCTREEKPDAAQGDRIVARANLGSLFWVLSVHTQ